MKTQQEYIDYLKETDWILIKLNEYHLKGDERLGEAVTKYADVLTARAEARENINIIEEQLDTL